MKIYQKICDRCKKEIADCQEDRISDFLERQYPGQDICPDCDLEIEAGKSLMARDLLNNEPFGTTLKRMCQMYGVEKGTSTP